MQSLYEQNRGLLYVLARRYRDACAQDRAVDVDDLMQAGFFGLVAAEQTFDPSAGMAWTSWAAQYIKSEMRAALGLATARRRAHTGALSLDEPLDRDDYGAATRGDLLADEGLKDAQEALERAEVASTVRGAIARIPNERQRASIEGYDLQGLSYRALGERLGTTPEQVRQARANALRALRRDKAIRALDLQTRFYAHKGLTAFRSDWTSTTEAAVLWRAEHERSRP